MVEESPFFRSSPPPGWEDAIQYPMQSAQMGEAFRTMGLVPYYVRDGARTALVQIRDPIGLGGSPLARGFVYPANEDRAFLERIVNQLRSRGVGFVRIGNTMWGTPSPGNLSGEGVRIIERHTFRLNLELSEQQLLRNMSGAERKIRKAEKSEIEVGECRSETDLEVYAGLARETSLRVRHKGGASAAFPLSFYRELLRPRLSESAAGVLLLCARHHGRVIAGNLFVIHRDTMLYYHGASSRDPSLTPLQAPAACFWAAIRIAKSRKIRVFDFGGHTPDLPPSDSRYGVYEFKRKWGGVESQFYNAEIVASPFRYHLQETVGKALWGALHPAYFRIHSWLRQRYVS